MNRVVLMVVALMLAPWPALSEDAATSKDRGSFSAAREGDIEARHDLLKRLSQAQLGERMVAAIEHVTEACASNISNFCGTVTPGEGRLLLCMRAYDDQLSRRCEAALERV